MIKPEFDNKHDMVTLKVDGENLLTITRANFLRNIEEPYLVDSITTYLKMADYAINGKITFSEDRLAEIAENCIYDDRGIKWTIGHWIDALLDYGYDDERPYAPKMEVYARLHRFCVDIEVPSEG